MSAICTLSGMNRLKALRERLGLNHQQMGDMIGLDRTTVLRRERAPEITGTLLLLVERIERENGVSSSAVSPPPSGPVPDGGARPAGVVASPSPPAGPDAQFSGFASVLD